MLVVIIKMIFAAHTKTMVVAVGIQINHCSVDGRQYLVGHPFSFEEDCFQFNCDCYPGGSWECPAERSKYICQLLPGQKIERGTFYLFLSITYCTYTFLHPNDYRSPVFWFILQKKKDTISAPISIRLRTTSGS